MKLLYSFLTIVQCVYSQHLLFVNNYSDLAVQNVHNRTMKPVLPTLEHLEEMERRVSINTLKLTYFLPKYLMTIHLPQPNKIKNIHTLYNVYLFFFMKPSLRLVLEEYHQRRMKRSSEPEGRRYVIYDRKPEEKKKKKKVQYKDILNKKEQFSFLQI